MPYVTLNQALQAFAARTGGVTAEPYTALVDVINNDPTLQSELNTDFSMGYLRGIVPMAPNGTGAQFNPTNLTIGLPIFQGSLEYLNSGDIAFTLGHEQDHSVNAGNIASETMSFDNGVQALIQQGGAGFYQPDPSRSAGTRRGRGHGADCGLEFLLWLRNDRESRYTGSGFGKWNKIQ